MRALQTTMTTARARRVLGVDDRATAARLRQAFRDAAKVAHPDRPGGDAERFRDVVEAFRLLQGRGAQPDPIFFSPEPARPATAQADPLTLSPLLALSGGEIEHEVAGRRLRIALPAGLRAGDRVRAGEAVLSVVIAGDGDVLVRGDDLWITARIEPRLLAEGGRVAVDTPLGRRIVWITRKAGARGLVRLVGQGLPRRGRHRQGHLFLRLTPASAAADSPARALLRRFAAAWAA